MKVGSIVIIAVLLIVSIGNYFRFISDGSIRNVEFLSIFAIGALSGILIFQIFKMLKNKN